MKKVIGMLVVVAFASSMAGAELLKNLKYSGTMDVKATSGDHSVTATKASFSNVNSRISLGMNFDLNDEINAQVTAEKTDYRNYGTASQSVDGLTASIFFSEAYINLKNVFGVNHKIGKQFYGKPGDIVIYVGPSYGPVGALANFSVSSLDGWYGEWKKDKLTVAALAAKVSENSATTPMDKDLYGVTAGYDFSEIVKPAVYVYQSMDKAVLGLTDTLMVVGAKAEGKYQGFGYGAEFAMNSGKDKPATQKYQGSAIKVNVDYALDAKEIGKFDFMGEYAMGSGDKAGAAKNEGFQAISSNYLPGLIFGVNGVGAATSGLTNLTTFNVGAKFMPKQIEKLSVGAKFYNFAYTEKVGLADAIGTELDFCAGWKHSENVGLHATYAMFTPDKKFADKDAETMFGLNLAVKF